MTEQKQYFTEEEMKERIIEVLEYYSKDDVIDVSDLHHDVFNSDYYIIGTYKAKEALNEFDVFEAIEVVQNWEMSMFGEKCEEISNPERFANLLWYILGENYMNELDLYQYETVGEMLEALQDGEQ